MIVLLVSTLSGIGASLLMKSLVNQPRPDIVTHLSHVITSSFPSGHSVMAAVNNDDFDARFTRDKPIIFAFHSYPSLVHQLSYRRTNQDNLHECDHGLDMPEIRNWKWEPPNE